MINFIIGYIFLLAVWATLNALCYALTIVTRKPVFSLTYAINAIINNLVPFLVLGYGFYILWQLGKSGEWLLFGLALVFGIFIVGFWQMVYEWLLSPFSAVTMYFVESSLKSLGKPKEEYEAEIISPEGKVISKIKSEDIQKKKLSLWFLVSYGLIMLWQLINKEGNAGMKFGDYVLLPLLILFFAVLIIGGILGVFNLIKKRHFFDHNAKEFLSSILKIFSIVYGALLFIELLIR